MVKKKKTNINEVKLCRTTELVEECLEFISELNKNQTSKLHL